MCLKLKRMLYERTLTSMIDPEVVTKGSGSWQLTGKIDDLDYADLVNLKANVEFALWEYDSQWMTEDNLTDVEADADTLASAGWGTDEDYGGNHV